MKSLTISILIFLCLGASAQEYKIKDFGTGGSRLQLERFTGNLDIRGYNGNEIIVTVDNATKPINEAKGLKPVYTTGNDNTGVGVEETTSGDKIILSCLRPKKRAWDYHIRIPENMMLKIIGVPRNFTETAVKGLKNEIDIKVVGNISLKNVSGPLVLSTINGKVKIDGSAATKEQSISVISTNGDIDLSIPEKTAANLTIGTLTGEIFSDFELPPDENKNKTTGGRNTTVKLHGGGLPVYLQTINGKIYLRKK